MSFHKGYSNSKKHYLYLKNLANQQKGGAMNDLSFEILADEIHFWGNQMREHCKFISVETKDKSIKKTAKELHDDLEKYMKKTFKDIDPEKIELDLSDIKIIGNSDNLDEKELRILLGRVRDLKISVKNATAYAWIGFTFPAEIDHMIKELDHFEANINGKLSGEEIAKFYAEEASEHTMLAHKLLNPSPAGIFIDEMTDLDAETQRAADKTKAGAAVIGDINRKNISESLSYVEDLLADGEDLDKKINNHEVKSIINPELIAHEGRESKRGIAIMKRYQLQN